MMNGNIFIAIAELASGAKARRDAELREFMEFYRGLVEAIPTDIVTLFGTMDGVKVRTGGKEESWSIELTATDYIWWKQKLDTTDARLIDTPTAIQLRMLNRLSKLAETQRLEPKERKRLIALLSPETT